MLPFAWVDTGRELFSLPHFNHAAGPLMKAKDQADALEQLRQEARKPLGMRLLADDFSRPLTKVVSLLPLNPDALSLKILHGNVARKIRASERKGVRVEQQGMDGLGHFMMIYERRLHQLGSANLPKKFFAALLQSYPDRSLDAEAMVHTAFYRKQCVGAAFSLRFGAWFENGWFATDLEAPSLYAAYALHNAMIRDAFASGATFYSFGRSSPGSGVHRFKQQWGTIDLPVILQFLPPRSYDLRNYPWLHKIWKNLPLTITRPFNPYLSKWLY